MKKLLFYYPSNKRSNPMETLMVSLKEKGLEVMLLTTCEKGDLQFSLEERGIKTFQNALPQGLSSYKYYWRQIRYLIQFCKEQQIDVVHSHLQHVNFIVALAQFFIRAKVVLFRHHGNFIPKELEHTIIINKREKVFDWVIQRLGKRIIVPSSGVLNIVKSEGKWNLSKFQILPYIYDFDIFPKPDSEKVALIKQQYPADFRLLSCSRLIPLKRPLLNIQLTEALIAKGFKVKLFVLDAGYLEDSLKEYVRKNNLEEHIIFLGFKTDFINYFSAIDILVHPSLTEASSSTVKELGLLKKAVVVCDGVGDFDDYIENGVNGIKVPKSDSETHFLKSVEQLLTDEKLRLQLGNNLHDTVIKKFDKSEEVIQMYLKEC